MPIALVKTPRIIKRVFPDFVWSINTTNKEIYLTFDDGPTPEITDWVLDLLNAYNAKATFFCIGNNIKKYPEIFKRILKNEHSVGNHTYNHLKGWKVSTKTYINDIEKTQKLIRAKREELNFNTKTETLQTTNLFRPPYGKVASKQSKAIQKLGYDIIMWDVLSYDWDTKINSETCFRNITSKANKGSIIVLHDSEKAFKNLKQTLPKVLEYFNNNGYNFKALNA